MTERTKGKWLVGCKGWVDINNHKHKYIEIFSDKTKDKNKWSGEGIAIIITPQECCNKTELKQREANADFIVSAVNNHDELLEACKDAAKLIRYGGVVPIEGQTWIKLQEAIAKAEAK
jgi:hypothetical protein